MYENPATHVKSKPAGLYRQSSRQAFLLRSHDLHLGRWHLKSLIITACFLLILLYYAHRMDLHQSGLKTKRRDLVVRPAKPYKSPHHRRRHTKLIKDGTSGLPIRTNANASLVNFIKKADMKLNKTKSALLQMPRPNEMKLTPSNVLKQKGKYSDAFSNKTPQDSLSQVNSGKDKVLNVFKGNGKQGKPKSFAQISGGLPKSLSQARTSDPAVGKVLIFRDGLGHPWSENSKDSKSLNIFQDTANTVKPVIKMDALVDVKNKMVVSGDNKNKIATYGANKNKIALSGNNKNKIALSGNNKNKMAAFGDNRSSTPKPAVKV